ncbi:MAG TPA: MBL fold metallo-hydrolase [Proteobacteria bacterium]|nr:MBL fold metallo-hydrolase [Pseudomonadota bacterium]
MKTPDDGIKGNGKYEGYNIVIDGGPSSRRIGNILPPLGLKYGSKVDWMINTHAHNDHYRGLIGLLDIYRVKRILDPGYQSGGTAFGAFCWRALIEPGGTFYSPVIGIATIPGLKSLSQSVPCPLNWGDELEVEILYSNPAVTNDTVNDSSIVIHLQYNLFSMLFTGDEEGKYRPSDGYNDTDHPMKVERFLLDHYVTEDKNLLKSTIIKIPHHGSETSSTTPFIKAVGAKEGIIFAGNRHGLPDETVIERYEEHGCRIWRTDRMDEGKSGSESHGDDSIIITSNGIDYDIRYMNIDPRDTEALARKKRLESERRMRDEAEKKRGEELAGSAAAPAGGAGKNLDAEPVLNTLD